MWRDCSINIVQFPVQGQALGKLTHNCSSCVFPKDAASRFPQHRGHVCMNGDFKQIKSVPNEEWGLNIGHISPAKNMLSQRIGSGLQLGLSFLSFSVDL